ncbi:hypothetical protein Acr_27g0001240 [Actinidia rufa]|uniref:Retrotransposon gag domain-containing protein n=1 Tax=Actinidia rufa TaxID=165716 RepID=A0A7J0H600_9ERIC|nr:hypothetical protein Acr_27g0001240 [Actinidia rufa]
MHLHIRLLPRSSASPLDNRAHTMASNNQAPDLEGLNHKLHGIAEQIGIMNENNTHMIQHLTTNNPLPPVKAPVPKEVDQSRRSHRSGGHESQSRHSTHQAQSSRNRGRCSSSLRSRRERSPVWLESRLSRWTHDTEGEETMRRGRSPRRNKRAPKRRDKFTTQKIRDLDASIDAINTSTNASITVDALIWQTKPPFIERGYSNEIMCKAFSATLKGSTRSWFRKLPPRTIDSFGDLSRLFVSNFISCRVRKKNASHLFTVHQKDGKSLKDYVKQFNQAVLEVEGASDKIVVMAMMEGLCPSPLFKTPFSKTDLIKRGYLRKYVANRPRHDLPDRRYGDNRTMAGDIQVIHGGIESGECLSLSRKRHAKSASGRVEEEVYNLSSLATKAHQPSPSPMMT